MNRGTDDPSFEDFYSGFRVAEVSELGPVPTLGNFGLGVLVATLLAAGGFVIHRLRVAASGGDQ